MFLVFIHSFYFTFLNTLLLKMKNQNSGKKKESGMIQSREEGNITKKKKKSRAYQTNCAVQDRHTPTLMETINIREIQIKTQPSEPEKKKHIKKSMLKSV